MIIGIDAGALSITDDRLKVGVWRVSFEFLKALRSIDRSKWWRLYSFRPIPKEVMREFGRNVENVVLSPPFGYMKFRLPLELLLHPVDAFLGLSQALPAWGGKKIGVVYDLRFRHNVETESSGKLEAQTDYLVRRADRIIAISQFVKEDIIRAYDFPKDRITVAYPGVTKFSSDTPCKKRNRPYFLFVGSLRRGKNIPELLEAFAVFLSKAKNPYDLVLAGGDKWYDKEIDEDIKRLQLDNRVHMTGYISDSELRCLYKHATAYVTTTKMEGFCLPIIEAFNNGCPVIAPRVGAIPEIVENAGILYSSGNSNELVHAMEEMEDSKKRNMYKKLGYVQSKKFSWDTFARTVYHAITL